MSLTADLQEAKAHAMRSGIFFCDKRQLPGPPGPDPLRMVPAVTAMINLLNPLIECRYPRRLLLRLFAFLALCLTAGCTTRQVSLTQNSADGPDKVAPIRSGFDQELPPRDRQDSRGTLPRDSRDDGSRDGVGPTELPRRLGASLDSMAPLAAPGDQFVYVDPGPASLTQGTVYAVQRTASGWELALAPVRANLGRNGVAPPWEKREGDGRTPSGLFPLRQAFGYPAALESRLPYRQLSSQDLWVDDPQSPDYNRWVRRGETAAGSFEELQQPLYRYGLVVEYNSAPAVRDLGSAIFVHVESGEAAPTAGCITLPEAALLRLLQWLDPARHPQLLVGTQGAVRALAAGVSSQLPAGLPPELCRRLLDSPRVLAVRRGKPGGFFGVAVSLPPELERQLLAKKSWRPGCPVAPGELAYLVTSFWGFDERPHYGELVLHQALCAFVIDSLQSAYNARFPIARMDLIEAFDADDERSMAANNSSAFNCRTVPGKPEVFSRHSFGAALDINPGLNPYLRIDGAALRARGWNGVGADTDYLATLGFTGSHAAGDFCRENPASCLVGPPAAAPFLERQVARPGMLQPGDPVLSAFAKRGFVWGGSWRIPAYQRLDYDIRKLAGP